MGFVWVNALSFFHCVASPFHSFVTTITGILPLARLMISNDTCMPASVFDVQLPAAYAPDYMAAAIWNGLHARDS